MRNVMLIAAVLAVASCGAYKEDVASREQRAQQSVQERMVQATPLPNLSYSAERVNLVKRANRLNTENLNGCVTLLSYGRVIAQYNVAGKVSSLNAYLTGDQRPTRFTFAAEDPRVNTTEMAESPDVDGTYGQNVDGVFFFEANTDAYVEWHGDFVYTDQCLTLNERPALVRAVH